MVFMVVFFYLVIISMEFPPLLKSKDKLKIFAYLTFSALSFTVNALLSVGLILPSPSAVIQKIIFHIIKK